MRLPALSLRLRVPARHAIGVVASAAVACALFTRFGINGTLSRDEAIYTYGAQRLAHGVPPYASIFDPKAPLATIIGGVAAALARGFGRNDIYAIRAAFFLCAVLTVVAVYLLVVRVWRSVPAGIAAAVVFASFNGFAGDALSGPDAKTPGILFAVVSMWLLARRNFAWAAMVGTLSFLVWQPLAVYPAVAVALAAPGSERGRRRIATARAVLAVLLPLAVTVIYFAAAGALGKFIEAAFRFPATGVIRSPVTFSGRFTRIGDVVSASYKFSGGVLYAGLICLAAVVAVHVVRRRTEGVRGILLDPVIGVVATTFLVEAAYALYDFQGYPDVYPLLPYAAIGLGGAVALLVEGARRQTLRRVVMATSLAAAAVLTGFSWAWFTDDPTNDDGFRAERADACAVQRILGPDGVLYALGNPAFVAVTHRANPDRYIYLGSGIDRWKVAHTPGGFAGWVADIGRIHPAVAAIGGWHTVLRDEMGVALRQDGYTGRYAGTWRLLLTQDALRRARAAGVALTRTPTLYAVGPHGHELPGSGC